VGFGRDVVDVFTVIDVDKHTCGVVVATSTFAWGSQVRIPLGPFVFF
jgi:hypothetical protein